MDIEKVDSGTAHYLPLVTVYSIYWISVYMYIRIYIDRILTCCSIVYTGIFISISERSIVISTVRFMNSCRIFVYQCIFVYQSLVAIVYFVFNVTQTHQCNHIITSIYMRYSYNSLVATVYTEYTPGYFWLTWPKTNLKTVLSKSIKFVSVWPAGSMNSLCTYTDRSWLPYFYTCGSADGHRLKVCHSSLGMFCICN